MRVSRYVAEDAVGLIEVEYEPVPFVVDVLEAIEENAPILHPHMGTNMLVTNPRGEGDPERGFAESDVVVEDTFRINRVSGLPMETRAILADWTPGVEDAPCTRLDAGPAPLPPPARTILTAPRSRHPRHLRRRRRRLRTQTRDLRRGPARLCPLDRPGSPRQVDRGQDGVLPGRDTGARVGAPGETRGRERRHEIVSYVNRYYVDAGAHNSPMGSPMLSSLMFQGPYKFPNGYVERNVVLTNKVPVGAYRGYGQPEGSFVREILIDRAARRLGIDRLKIRRKNFIRPEDMPWQTIGGAKYDSGDYRELLDMAAETIGYQEVLRQQADARADGRYLGVGFGCYVEMTGYPGSKFLGRHNAQYGAHEGVVIRANRSGGVDVYTAVPPIGQSTETAFGQVAASVIGLDPAKVRVFAGDTHGTPVNTGSFASRTLIAGSGAIERAGSEVREKALRVAAHMLAVPLETLQLENSMITSSEGPSISFEEVALNAFYAHRMPEGELPGLEATAYYDPISNAFSYGTAAAIVEVEPESGEFTLERFLFVHDCGTQVNPLLVEGQLHGGIAQALGAALFEEIVYDQESGQLVNGSMMDYFMPTAADLPRIELDHTETASPITPFGIRGIGESGTIPPGAAVANALADALAPYGVEINRLPLTAEYIWRLLAEKERVR